MRLYLPATLPLLGGWHAAATAPAGLTAYGVTPMLREWYADGDDEELEWAAQTLAGRASLRLLGAEVLEATAGAAGPRRVVLAVDAPDADVVVLDGVGRGSLRIGGPVGARAWAAVLVDEVASVPVVASAAAAIALADGGDEDAAFAVSEADDAELLWYATEELATLLA